MTSHEPDLPERDIFDGNPGPLPLWRIHPSPLIFARMIRTCRQRPQWSPQDQEETILALRMRIAPQYDVEAAVTLFRAMAEKPFDEATERMLREDDELSERLGKLQEEWEPDWPEQNDDELEARARRELQAEKEAIAQQGAAKRR